MHSSVAATSALAELAAASPAGRHDGGSTGDPELDSELAAFTAENAWMDEYRRSDVHRCGSASAHLVVF